MPSSVEGTIFLPEVLMTMYMCVYVCVCGVAVSERGQSIEYNQISLKKIRVIKC